MLRAKSDKQRRALIEATIRVVARVGRPDATVGMVAREAGLATGIVSFYFGGKDALFAAAFDDLIGHYDGIVKRHLDRAGKHPAQRLSAIIDAAFDPEALERTRIAAWFAFWAHEMSRRPRGDPASRREVKYTRANIVELRRLAATRGAGQVGVDPVTVGTGLTALFDGYWWAIMRTPRAVKVEQAAAACRAYLAALYPGLEV
jgi:TetR/AcrR family transcriptional repressor of bet genes